MSAGAKPAGAGGRVGTQTLALLVDAYRELNAKKLFWITMGLSGLVVVVCACFGINERGLTFLKWEFPSPLTSQLIPPAKFYKYIFAALGVPIWLSWAASILAIISTAGIFPDFISGGSIELALSKPISRLRLFLTKYAMGLLFVFLQVLAFTTASFLVIGVRGGHWDFALFLAVPIILCFFSYLFCFCVLVGLLTRSTIASILFTGLFWMFLFAANTADGLLLTFKGAAQANVQAQERRVARAERNGESDSQLEARRAELASQRATMDSLTWWYTLVYRAKTVVPKTDDTIKLLNRYLLTAEEKALIDTGGAQRGPQFDDPENFDQSMQAGAIRADQEGRERPLWWVVGTSLGFEAVVVGIGAWIFVRRDF